VEAANHLPHLLVGEHVPQPAVGNGVERFAQLGESWARLTLGLIEFMAENADEATRHLERSLAMHEALGHRLGVSRSLTFLGATMTLIPSRPVQAREDLKRALQTAHALTDSWGEGFALYFLGLADLDAGEHKPAATHLCGALRTEALGPIRAGALEGLAQLANEHDPRRAMRLLGAANSLRERHAGRPPPFIRRRAAAIRAHAEQRIDAAAAEQAWNDGRQMTTEEALAYALGDHQPRHDLQPQDIETTSAS
jgi:hypothetical protein